MLFSISTELGYPNVICTLSYSAISTSSIISSSELELICLTIGGLYIGSSGSLSTMSPLTLSIDEKGGILGISAKRGGCYG
jgi:hypothetical protein